VAADEVIDGEDHEDKEIKRDDDFFGEEISLGEGELRGALLPGETQAVPVSSTSRQEKRKTSFILAIARCRFVSFSEILCKGTWRSKEIDMDHTKVRRKMRQRQPALTPGVLASVGPTF